MQLAHLCYVIALGVLAAAFSLGIVSMAFGEASLVPVSIALYLDAAVIPMTACAISSDWRSYCMIARFGFLTRWLIRSLLSWCQSLLQISAQ